jgi:hypothetical protein
MPAVKLLLKPHESKQEDGGYGHLYQSPPTEMELTIDFVEFADGTRWGDDTSRFADILDGMRAGGKAALKRYREILANEGAQGLEEALAGQNPVRPDAAAKPAEWNDGLTMGVNTVNRRLKAAKAKDGLEGVKRELDKPFDATEGRQEP